MEKIEMTKLKILAEFYETHFIVNGCIRVGEEFYLSVLFIL